MKDEAIALYLECVRENGLSRKQAARLPVKYHRMLERKKEKGKFFLAARFRKMFTVALTGGVFDIIHPGHVLTLNEAKKHADVLVVVVATDGHVKKVKKRKPLHSAKVRAEVVGEIKAVDIAIVGVRRVMDTFERIRPDVVVFGYDQRMMKLPGVECVQVKKHSNGKYSKTGKVMEKLGI
jgi:cytidyltransferase-like protein